MSDTFYGVTIILLVLLAISMIGLFRSNANVDRQLGREWDDENNRYR